MIFSHGAVLVLLARSLIPIAPLANRPVPASCGTIFGRIAAHGMDQ